LRIEVGRWRVRLASGEDDLVGALRLRHRVFAEELGGFSAGGPEGLEKDRFDPVCEHLILEDLAAGPEPRIVGTYRLLSGEAATNGPGFYSSGEFDLAVFAPVAAECLEVGRTCVDPAYRGGPAMSLLWAGLASLVFAREVRFLFGCASFPGLDPAPISQALSLLRCEHMAPEEIRARALQPHRLPLGGCPCGRIDREAAARQMPSLIKGYLRLGGFCGDGAYPDCHFGVIDVFLVVDVERVGEAQRRFYRDRLESTLARLAG